MFEHGDYVKLGNRRGFFIRYYKNDSSDDRCFVQFSFITESGEQVKVSDLTLINKSNNKVVVFKPNSYTLPF